MRERCGTEGLGRTETELGIKVSTKGAASAALFYECGIDQEQRNECILNGERST